MCVFEFIYFARPDSIIEGSSVHEARKQAGRFLAQEHPVQADVVIGVPDSGLDAALGYSEESGIPYGIGFIKNKYIGSSGNIVDLAWDRASGRFSTPHKYAETDAPEMPQVY